MNGIESMNDCLYPWAQPEGIKNVHALNPILEPIILQIHTFNLPKLHEKPPFILPLSTFKSSRKIGDLLGMYHSKQVHIHLGA